jgi:hypothetical protein
MNSDVLNAGDYVTIEGIVTEAASKAFAALRMTPASQLSRMQADAASSSTAMVVSPTTVVSNPAQQPQPQPQPVVHHELQSTFTTLVSDYVEACLYGIQGSIPTGVSQLVDGIVDMQSVDDFISTNQAFLMKCVATTTYGTQEALSHCLCDAHAALKQPEHCTRLLSCVENAVYPLLFTVHERVRVIVERALNSRLPAQHSGNATASAGAAASAIDVHTGGSVYVDARNDEDGPTGIKRRRIAVSVEQGGSTGSGKMDTQQGAETSLIHDAVDYAATELWSYKTSTQCITRVIMLERHVFLAETSSMAVIVDFGHAGFPTTPPKVSTKFVSGDVVDGQVTEDICSKVWTGMDHAWAASKQKSVVDFIDRLVMVLTIRKNRGISNKR